MPKVFLRLLAAAALSLGSSWSAQADDLIAPAELVAGDHVEVRGNGGQTYLLSVVAVRDGVLLGRCLRSGSEFRGELSAISGVRRLSVSPDQDMAPLIALIGSGLDHSAAAAAAE